MSLLTVIQHVCQRTNLSVPATVLGTTDPQVVQLYALLEEEGNDLSQRGAWEAITLEATLSTLAAEDQGSMSSIASNGFRYIKNETIWDRTDQLPVSQMDGKGWQALKATASTSPRYTFRIRGGKLLVNPIPTAGQDWRFEYISKNWILGADATTYKQYFTLDTDTILLPEELVIMGLRWRWMREKGLDYAELFHAYEAQLKDMLGRDGGKQTFHMDGEQRRGPGVFVPSGSWITP